MRSSLSTNNVNALIPYTPLKENSPKPSSLAVNNDNEVIDLAHSIYYSLPEIAKQYYIDSSEKDFKDWITPLGRQNGWYIRYLKCFQTYKIYYLNSNELLCAIIDSQHKIFKGPGIFHLTNNYDKVVKSYTLGQDIDFGPIKVIYVKPGTLRYATHINTGKPMLLGPGMHYLHDFNIQVTSKEIIMNFKGENTQLFIDDIMSLSFVYVKTGYEALIVDRKGEFKSLPSGLYFLQSPASFKTFVSIADVTNNGNMFNSLFTSVSTTFVPTELEMKKRAMATANETQDSSIYNLLILKENSDIDVAKILFDAGVTNGNLLRVLIQSHTTDESCNLIVTKMKDSLKLVPRIMFISYLKSFQ